MTLKKVTDSFSYSFIPVWIYLCSYELVEEFSVALA